jgi:hypothetical protein
MPTKTLRELASIRTGYPFRGRAERVGDGGCVLVQVGNINGEAGEMAGEPTRITAPANWREHVLNYGDVLVIARGPRNDAATFTWEAGQAVAASHILILRTEGKIAYPEYLTWFLNHPATQARIKAMRSESSVPFVSVDAMARLHVPVPSIDTQNHVAAIQKLKAQEQRLLEGVTTLRRTLVDGLLMAAVRRETDEVTDQTNELEPL